MTPAPAKALREIEAVNDALRKGYPARVQPGFNKVKSAERIAADALGVNPYGFHSRLLRYKREHGIEPDWTLGETAEAEPVAIPEPDQFTAYEQIHAQPKPRIRVPYRRHDAAPEGTVYRVLGIGDVHTKPGRSTEHLTWVARHAAATAPDILFCIGDFLSLDSLSNHPPKGSFRDSERPSFPADLEAGEEALAVIDREVPELPKEICLGNHEQRAWTAADMDPRRAGDMPLRVEQTFARFRWRVHPYRQMVFIGGVGFTHVPINQMGREYGGKHSENTIGNDATHSLVWGHDHRFRTKTVPKIGLNNRIDLCNLGTCLPHSEIEDYSVGTTGWTYGCVDLRIQGGLIISAKFNDLLELREKFGD